MNRRTIQESKNETPCPDVRALGQQDEAQAAGQDAYRGTRAIINVPFTSAESLDTRRTRGKDCRARGAKVCGCASRNSKRALPFVLHAPAETNLADKSWSYDRALSRAGKEIADARAPRPTAAAPRDSDRYHVNCMPSRLCTRGRRDATVIVVRDARRDFPLCNKMHQALNLRDIFLYNFTLF